MPVTSKVTLPIVDRTRMSRIAGRRLKVLLLVQMLIIAHVLLWWLSQRYGWFGGWTLGPVEPSESIQTVTGGIINAGAIFFAVALLSTAVLGRWFCGWGCHVLLLQDGCTWILKKVGIRPRAFRSRLLMLAPLALALYMFVWPLFYRFVWAPINGIDLTWPGFSTHILVRDFWATFPGVVVAVFFLFICGVLTVYMLGSKGFCTYGCPYGGFFAPLDRIAPLRIRVNENCRGCAECTAVCTSNVRVHEEVATHGMVVDSGCMKTMDCIEACPNDALSLGLGASGARTGRPRRSWDLTWPQEAVFALIMLLLFLAWRGAFGVVPMLMAMGVAACGTWLLWTCLRVFRLTNVKWLRWQLRLGGRVTGRGAVVLALGAFFAIASVWTGAVQAASFRASFMFEPVSVRAAIGEGPALGDVQADVEKAQAAMQPTRSVSDGGWAIWENPVDRYRRARLSAMQGDLDAAHAEMVLVMAAARPDEGAWRDAFALKTVLLGDDDTQAWAEGVLADRPDWGRFRGDVVAWMIETGRTSEALDVAQARMSVEDGRKLMLKAVELLNDGRAAEALPLMEAYVEAMPADVLARASLARLLQAMGHHEAAAAQMQRAIDERHTLPPAQLEALSRELEAFNSKVEGR